MTNKHPAHPVDEEPLDHIGEEVDYDWNDDPDKEAEDGRTNEELNKTT